MPNEKLVEQKKKKVVVSKKKRIALDAVVVDALADELPAHIQEKLPEEGVLVEHAPDDNLLIKTSIVSELPPAGIVTTPKISEEDAEKQKKTIAEAIGPINIAEPILEHTDPNKGEQASEALNFISDQMKEEATVLIERNRLVIAKALLMASHILKTSSKTVKFFSKFKRKNKKK